MIRATLAVLMMLLWQAADGDEALFFACKSCHGEQGQGSEALDAPAIAGMERGYFTRQLKHFRDGVRGKSLEDLPGRQMSLIAAVLRDDADIEALAGYVAAMPRAKPLETLTAPGADASKLFAPCSVCHGSKGEGNRVLGGPAIAWLDDWYLLRQLRNFRAGIRGSDERDIRGREMRGSVAALSDAEIRALASYVPTLSLEPSVD